MGNIFRCALVAAVCVLGFSIAASSDESYNIKPLYKKGFKADVKEVNKMDMKVTMPGMGAITTTVTSTTNYSYEILEADDAGATKEKIKVTESSLKQTMPMQPAQTMESGLKGQTVTLTWNGDDEVDVECTEELPDEAEQAAQELITRNKFISSFPDKPVPVGYKFSVDGEKLDSMLKLDVTSGKAEMVFEKVEDHNGKKSAAIAVKVDLKAEIQGTEASIAMSGYMWVALETGQENGTSMKGKLSATIPETDESPAIQMNGDMELKQDVTIAAADAGKVMGSNQKVCPGCGKVQCTCMGK